jgi:hypothetical protein
MDSGYRTVLDMDSTEIPVYGEQEQSSYNGYFESTCFHPLLLFNGEGECLAAKLRPGNVHSAEGWEELLLPEIERQQRRVSGNAVWGVGHVQASVLDAKTKETLWMSKDQKGVRTVFHGYASPFSRAVSGIGKQMHTEIGD